MPCSMRGDRQWRAAAISRTEDLLLHSAFGGVHPHQVLNSPAARRPGWPGEAAAPVLSNEDLARSVGKQAENTGQPDTSGSAIPWP